MNAFGNGDGRGRGQMLPIPWGDQEGVLSWRWFNIMIYSEGFVLMPVWFYLNWTLHSGLCLCAIWTSQDSCIWPVTSGKYKMHWLDTKRSVRTRSVVHSHLKQLVTCPITTRWIWGDQFGKTIL
jgi:hypothetical protein